MASVVGIDLGTTNSLVAALDGGQPWVIPDEAGELLLPSVVGVNAEGQLLVGQAARRQYAVAPERTVRSIKRQIGSDAQVPLGEKTFRPQEISALILRTLRERAETALGDTVEQAVITVPAYFTDAQRQATKEAGEIAGLEVLQILNEPTAAALVFDRRREETQRLMVYDLGGGTFDVSIVEITGPVTEVLASHGNNRLGGDDFDRRLQRLLAERFEQSHGAAP
ncbi:MAG TPA: Hsp70 family protein, partial [Cyanobium sp.]|nr:Hsp70 family protein [Cyanobium sp.]